MAYQEVKCDYCGMNLGEFHGYQSDLVLYHHFKKHHEKEYREVLKVVLELRKLRTLYKIYFSSRYFRSSDMEEKK